MVANKNMRTTMADLEDETLQSSQPQFILMSDSYDSYASNNEEQEEREEEQREQPLPKSRSSPLTSSLKSKKNNKEKPTSLDRKPSLPAQIDSEIKHLEILLGPSHPSILTTLLTVAHACSKNGDYPEALTYYRQCLDFQQQQKRRRHGSSFKAEKEGEILCFIAGTLKDLGEWKKSLETYKQALDVYSGLLVEGTKKKGVPEVVLVKENGAVAEETLELRCRMISIENNIGNLRFSQRDFSSAMMHFKRALAMGKRAEYLASEHERSPPTPAQESREIEGKDTRIIITSSSLSSSPSTPKVHPSPPLLQMIRLSIADTLNNLASVHSELGNRSKAVTYYNSTLTLQTSVLGEDDPKIANTLNNLGTMHYRSGNFSMAMKSYKQVLKMRRNLLGKNDLSVADVWVNISCVHDRLGELERAEKSYLEARRIVVLISGEKCGRCVDVGRRLGEFYRRHGRWEEAVKIFGDILETCRELNFHGTHPMVLRIKKNLAEVKYEHQDDLNLMIDVFWDTANLCGSGPLQALSIHDDENIDSFLGNLHQARAVSMASF